MAEIVTVVVGLMVPLIGLAQAYLAYKQKRATELARQASELAKDTKEQTAEMKGLVNHRMDELLATVKQLAKMQGIEQGRQAGREEGRIAEVERRSTGVSETET